MSLGSLYVFSREVFLQAFCPFFNWVVCLPGVELCEFFLYFGDQTLIWGIIGKCIFLYHCFSFHFNAVFFGQAEAFLFWWGPIFLFFSFISLALGDVSVRKLLHGMSELFLPMFSSRVFMVSQLIFKSFTHLEFVFVCSVSCFFFFWHVAVQISQHHLLKMLFLLHIMLLPPLSNIN